MVLKKSHSRTEDKEEYPLVVHRTNGPPWIFAWDEELDGYVYRGKKHTYKIMFPGGDLFPQIWIGRLVRTNRGKGWITIEREIGATSISFQFSGYYRFNRGRNETFKQKQRQRKSPTSL